LLLGAAPLSAATYYVATSGSDTRDGTSPQQAWGTVTYAATRATAGDTVYIKAGLYRGENVVVRNSGTEKAPIIFQGYKDRPGDRPDPMYRPGGKLNPGVLPVLEGEAGKGTGIAIQNRSYIELRSLGLTSYLYGLFPEFSQHIVVENVLAVSFGSETTGAGEGQGLWFRDCAHCAIRNCVVADASMQNITLERTHNTVVENCKSHAVVFDPKPAATDYHIVIIDGHDNVVRGCLAQNLHSEHTGTHPGHGIGIKDRAGPEGYAQPHSRGNKISDCVARNMGEYFFVAHEAHHNEFINCRAIGQWRTQSRWSEGINIRDGAHDNTFRGCRVAGARTSVTLQDTVEGPTNPDGSPLVQICSENTVSGCVFTDSEVGVEVWNADGNVFRNCVFDGAGGSALVRFPLDRTNTGNTCRNTIVTNVRGAYQQVDKGTGGELPFTYSDFWANAFGMPAGTGNLARDPLFARSGGGRYHLRSRSGRWDQASSRWVKDRETSPCIDAGDPADDSSAEPKPNGGRINLGAYGGTREASRSP
jgi:parallel beta-helix repeat protein